MKKLFCTLFVNKKNFALVRAALALVLAVAVLVVSGFAFVYQLQGPTAVQDAAELADGSYISTDVRWIMDVCGSEVNSEGKTLYYYAIAPIGNRFVLLRFGAGMLEDLTELEGATMDYLTGESLAMDFHLPVRGMVRTAEQGAYSLLSEWFNNNIEWMELAGVVGADPSAAKYLAKEAVFVDQVGSMHWLASLGMSALAALLVLYALAEGLLVLVGFYKSNKVAERARKRQQERKKREKAAKKAAELEAQKAAEEPETEKSKTEEPAAEEIAVEEAVTEEPAVEEAAAEEIKAEEPAAEEAAVEEAPAEETVTEEAVAEETVAEETVAEEAVTEEPAVEEPTAEEPETEEQKTEEPAAEAPAANEVKEEEAPVEEAEAEETVVKAAPETSEKRFFLRKKKKEKADA